MKAPKDPSQMLCLQSAADYLTRAHTFMEGADEAAIRARLAGLLREIQIVQFQQRARSVGA